MVLVPFDFTDGSGKKWRPAVVVSSDAYHQESPDVLIASITSNLQALPHPGDHPIGQWQGAGLLKPSLAQAKIATIESDHIGRKLGVLAPSDLAAVTNGLRRALEL